MASVEYGIFRNSRPHFEPRTPHAALRAYQGGFLPPEVFMFRSGSTKPLDEEPFDIAEIERILSHEDMELQTILMLMGIFRRMIESRDQETALFAAESMNIIENRYNGRIRTIRAALEAGDDPESCSELARLNFELALINETKESMRNFYLREAYRYLEKLSRIREMNREEQNCLIRTLLFLQLTDQARTELARFRRDEPFYGFLEAEIEFAARNFERVGEILRNMRHLQDDMDKRELELYAYWTGT